MLSDDQLYRVKYKHYRDHCRGALENVNTLLSQLNAEDAAAEDEGQHFEKRDLDQVKINKRSLLNQPIELHCHKAAKLELWAKLDTFQSKLDAERSAVANKRQCLEEVIADEHNLQVEAKYSFASTTAGSVKEKQCQEMAQSNFEAKCIHNL